MYCLKYDPSCSVSEIHLQFKKALNDFEFRFNIISKVKEQFVLNCNVMIFIQFKVLLGKSNTRTGKGLEIVWLVSGLCVT